MVYIMLADGFEEIEALTVADILVRAGIDMQTVSVYNNDIVTGAHGIKVVPDMNLCDIDNNYEMIVLPGGMPGTLNLQKNHDLEEMILDAYDKNKYIGAICAAPMILGELGLLKERKATCYPSFENHLHGAKCSLDSVCVDGNIITSRGAGTAHDFAFEMVKLLKNSELAEELRSGMIYG